MLLKCCYQNILETSTVTLATGAEDAAYPLWRLSDRDIGLMFKAQAAVTLTVKIVQGATLYPVDRLLIPGGHNLSGMVSDIKWSDDDITYTAAVAQWVSAAGDIDKSWAPLTKKYWKLILTSPGVIPSFAELFLTSTYTWEKNPPRPTGEFDPVFNVERLQSRGGQVRFITHGQAKRQRTYTMRSCGQAQRANLEALNNAWAGSKPFWLYDHEGTLIYGELRKPIALKEIYYQGYPFVFDFLEVIP
ncbi:MAG: hypothetical protein M0024_01275 [Nitrospiraceae bacterium]|nr:hypothetical protein [Nitrospiraceae bacterium]